MSEFDWELSSGAPLCLQSDSFYHAVRYGIVQQLRIGMTTEQWDAVFAHLTALREQYQRDVHPMHYGSLVGGHRCVRHLYREANAILRGLQLTMPVPQPPPPPDPAPEPKPRSLRDVLGDLPEEENPNDR